MAVTIWDFIKEYNSTHDDSLLALVRGNKWAHVTGRLSSEASKVKWEESWYTAYKVRNVWEWFWIWKIIFTNN